MPFVGVAVIKAVSDQLVRITGISLAGNTAGTIGLFGDGGADLQLPRPFIPGPYGTVDLEDAIQCWYVHTDPGGGGESRHLHIDKTSGPFRITITNDQGTATSPLEVYVRYH